MLNYDETDENLDESCSEQYIDPSQLIMIQDNHWTPSDQFVIGYATQLGFDLENDPPEMLDIAEKYLTVEIPEIYQRAFTKENYRLVYINRITNEIKLESDIEIQAKQEYQEEKKTETKKDEGSWRRGEEPKKDEKKPDYSVLISINALIQKMKKTQIEK